VQLSDSTLHNAMSRLNADATVWCYVDAENSYELTCRKVSKVSSTPGLSVGEGLSIKGQSVDVVGASVISATRFSDTTAVVCSDNPGVEAANPNPTGPLQCALLLTTPADDGLTVNGQTGIKSLSTGSILTLSVFSFTETNGAACYTSSGAGGTTKVSCTAISLAGRDMFSSTLVFGNTMTISDGAEGAAAVALSADSGMVCYTKESKATACTRVRLTGSTISKGDEVLVASAAAPHLSLAAFSPDTAVACFEKPADGVSECYAMDAEDGAVGAALVVDDAKAGQRLAVTSMSSDSGVVCYQSASGRGICKDLALAPGTATETTTTFATETVTETTGTETATSETSVTTATATGTTTTFATETASETSSTTNTGSTTATATTTTVTGTTFSATPGAVTAPPTTTPADEQQQEVLSGAAGARCAVALALGALAPLLA